MKTVFLRALEADDKAAALRELISEPESACGGQRFEMDAPRFSAVPRSPFSYWVSDRLRRLFSELPPFEADGRSLSIGASTKNDFRYVRSSTEVTPSDIAKSREETRSRRWVPFAKGGKFSPFYADVHLLVDWADDGSALKADISEYRGSRGWGYQWSAALNGHSRYFCPGLTWPLRTQGGLLAWAMPANCVFGHKGPAAFVEGDESNTLLALLAIANTRAFFALVDLQMAFGSYEVGVIQRTPMPDLKLIDRSVLSKLAERAWSLKRSLDLHTETSHAFTLPALLQVSGETLSARSMRWAEQVRAREAELSAIHAEIDERCFALYGISEDDRRSITEGLGSAAVSSGDSEGPDDQDDAGTDDDTKSNTDAVSLAAELVSWAVGVAFGRFDLRLASGARALPGQPQPFDPLPLCSPAMLTGEDGLPLTCPPAGYPLSLPENGILVNDPGQVRDLMAAVRRVFDEVFESNADAWWNEATMLLDPLGRDLRGWLASSFFEHHVKSYSKSRRKAPVLWQLAVPSVRYSVWLYAHRLTRDSFFQIQNDVVIPKLAHEERQLTNLIQSAGASPSANERKEIAHQQAFVEELRSFLVEVRRVAPLWNPALDDGVAVTMAPLWRLVPQSKLWQKELKSKWDELASGKYDWARLAMHLWPERVIPKCATDRGLAIAHGLEDVFWAEDADGKWKTKSSPSRTVDELIRERSSPAVKSALKILLESPDSAPTSRRRRRDIEAGALS